MARLWSDRRGHDQALLSATAAVVLTEFRCASLAGCIALWLRFRWNMGRIAAGTSGLTANWTIVSFRGRRLVHVSCWQSFHASYSLGESRCHVRNVRWAMSRADIRTRSVLFEQAGDYRDSLLRDRYGRARNAHERSTMDRQ